MSSLFESLVSYFLSTSLRFGLAANSVKSNIAFPTFPARWTFYTVFIFLCFGWIYLTSIYSSVIYASGILIVPHLLIALLGFAYSKTFGRFNRTTKTG